MAISVPFAALTEGSPGMSGIGVRWDSCTVFREKNRRDKTTDEVDAGTPALQREWLAAGNTDVCQECGKGREGGGREILWAPGEHKV